MNDFELEDMIKDNRGLAYKLANKFYHKNGGHIEFDDFLSVAMFGLYKACKVYNSNKGSLSTIAYTVIERELLKRIKTYNLKREEEYRKNVYFEELLPNCECEDITYLDTIRDEKVDIESQYEDTIIVDEIKRRINKKSDRDAYILRQYFFNERTMCNIALEVGLTDSRVQQITSNFRTEIKRSRIIKKLR